MQSIFAASLAKQLILVIQQDKALAKEKSLDYCTNDKIRFAPERRRVDYHSSAKHFETLFWLQVPFLDTFEYENRSPSSSIFYDLPSLLCLVKGASLSPS